MKKRNFVSRIISNTRVADKFYTMELTADGVIFNAGQFFQIEVPQHTLKRPFAPSYSDTEKFAYTYQIVGEGTEILSTLSPGTELSVIAPLGNGFGKPATDSIALLAGGGCGTPSLALLAQQLHNQGTPVYAIIGARSSCTILERDTFSKYAKKLIITTDDGSAGIKGNTVDGVRSILSEVQSTGKELNLFSCGPVPMLRGLALLAAGEDIRAELSFEERMACGFGACMGCVIKIKDSNTPEGFKYRRVCHDGPVFAATEIYWE